MTAFAQINITRVVHEADTLVLPYIDLYKGTQGYLLKMNSDLPFEISSPFYIGETKQEALRSLTTLAEICNNDVGTYVEVSDAKGRAFYIVTGTLSTVIRRPSYIPSNRIYIKDDEMIGYMPLNLSAIKSAIDYLSQTE